MSSAVEPATLKFRRARRSDVTAIVRMLAADTLGAQREDCTDPLPPEYFAAFDAINADPAHELIVAEIDTQLVGTLQLSFLPSLSHRGALRAQIEAVRVDASLRGRGIGRQVLEWALARARERGCAMVQLSSDLSRLDAQRFYAQLGFVASHVGMKLKLRAQQDIGLILTD